MNRQQTITTGAAVIAQANRVRSLLLEAQDPQWSASKRSSRNETGIRAKGTHSDPVPSIVMDERRQRLREAVKNAERELLSSEQKLERAAGKLTRALEAWAGG